MSAVNWVMVDDVAGEQWDSCERILDLRKGLGASMPIVVLGAQSAAEDRMLLLEVGNDNDLSKPVSPKDLLARVRQVMEKLAGAAASRSVAPEEVVSFGDVRVDLASMEATRAGRVVPLRTQEFKIVRYFAEHPGRVISRDVLLNEVWGYNNYPSTRTVDNHILRLRHKLEPDPARPQYFLTIHGVGYKFVPSGVRLAA
jgi:DNA-binding response OmpR family regulator